VSIRDYDNIKLLSWLYDTFSCITLHLNYSRFCALNI
jgi:hypothetical protein